MERTRRKKTKKAAHSQKSYTYYIDVTLEGAFEKKRK